MLLLVFVFCLLGYGFNSKSHIAGFVVVCGLNMCLDSVVYMVVSRLPPSLIISLCEHLPWLLIIVKFPDADHGSG